MERIKKIVLYVVVLLLGLLIGAGTCYNHYRHIPAQVDTVYKYEKVPYTPLELKGNTYELEIPQINVGKHVFIDVALLDTVYRDSIRYVVYPRQYYYTKVKDAEIWHSGIDSTIDSLNVVQKSTNITNTYKAKEKKNTLSLGLETSYCSTFSIPIYLEYERMLHKNVGFNASLFYDLPLRQYGVAVGINVQIGW